MTPLTCRSLSAFAAFPSTIYLAFAFEKRWSPFQILIEAAIVGMVLIGIAAIRAHAEFDGNAALVWGWRLGLAVGLLLLIASESPWRGRAVVDSAHEGILRRRRRNVAGGGAGIALAAS